MDCQIFISYKRDGGDDFAYRIYKTLTDDGYRAFLDTKSMWDCDYEEEIEKNIKGCDDFILVLSKGALDKCNDPEDYVRKEIEMALKYGRHIVPVMKKGFAFPNNMPEEIKDVRSQNGVEFPTEYFEAAYLRLVIRYLKANLDDSSLERDERVKREAVEGSIPMMNEYALKNETGTKDTFEDLSEAYKYYLSATEGGLPAAYYNLGDIYEKCSEDPLLADEYKIDKSDCCTDDICGWFLSLATENYGKAGEYAPALYRLGVICEKNKETDTAFEYYLKSASQDYPPALNAVGFFYQHKLSEKAVGGEKTSASLAEEYYDRAAKKGLTAALYNLGRIRESGGKYNEDGLVSLYKRAFYGTPVIPQAAFALAKFYENKKQEINTARHYYQLALESGFFRAEKDLSRLEKKIISSR